VVVDVVVLGYCVAVFRSFSFEGLGAAGRVGWDVAEEDFPSLWSVFGLCRFVVMC
jgi:hypothetical protein